MTEYDDALRLRRDGDSYFGQLSASWAIAGAINGGLLMALSAVATADAAPQQHPHPLTYSSIFLSPSSEGEVEITPSILRSGRRMSSAEAVVRQSGTERIRALMTLGNLDDHAEPVRMQPQMPPIPPREKCIAAADAPPGIFASADLISRFDMRMDPDNIGWALGKPSGNGRMRGWIRLADGHEPDPISLLLFLDAFPPVALDLGSTGWVPTVEFTAYIRAVPAPGWLAMELSTSTVTGGLLEEDARIWDSTGRLVAHSRQLASARFAE